MKKANIIASIIFGAVAVIIIIYTMSFPPGKSGVPGPGMFPIMIAGLMLFCSLIVLVTAWMSKDDQPFVIIGQDNIRVYITTAVLIAYIFLLPKLGFCVTSVPLLTLLIKWFGRYHIAKCFICALIAVVAVYWVFSNVLMVSLKFGILI